MSDKVMCPHCKALSSDMEFCDNCGRAISSEDEKKSYIAENRNKWLRGTLPCVIVEGDLEEGLISNTKYREFNNVELPSKIVSENNKNMLYFLDSGEENLESWIKNRKLDLSESTRLILGIGDILNELQEHNYVLGSLNLSDFWIEKNNMNRIFLRQTKPFILEGKIPERYSPGKIVAPEVINNENHRVDFSADVFLLGKLYSILVLNEYEVREYAPQRYMSNQLRLFNSEIDFEFHSWIGKTLNIYPEDRFPNIDQALKEFYHLMDKSNHRKHLINEKILQKSDVEIIHKEITHVGEGKEEAASEYKDKSKLNEDSFLFLQEKSEESKIFALVADGISTCKYGSGYDASNITVDMAKKLWENRNAHINTEEDVKKFFDDLVCNVNLTIVEKVMSILNDEDREHISSADIMGTTMVSVILLGNTLYYVSIGDSRIYLWNKESGAMLLNYDDNLGNEYLKNRGIWYEYENMEDKSSIVNFLGGADVSCWPFKVRDTTVKVHKCNLFNGETIILCSDGLTDYINPIGHRNDEWDKDIVLDRLIRNNIDEGIDKVCEKFIEEANSNGGGDNITAVVINFKTNID